MGGKEPEAKPKQIKNCDFKHKLILHRQELNCIRADSLTLEKECRQERPCAQTSLSHRLQANIMLSSTCAVLRETKGAADYSSSWSFPWSLQRVRGGALSSLSPALREREELTPDTNMNNLSGAKTLRCDARQFNDDMTHTTATSESVAAK